MILNRKPFLLFAAVLIAVASIGIVIAQNNGEAATEAVDAPPKLVVVFQKQKDPRAIQETAERVAKAISDEIGIPVEVMVPASYGASVQALVSNKAQVAYMSSIPYLLARQEAPMKIALAEVRDGKTDYDSIFVVAQDSPIQSLEDLRGKRMMWTSATSTSGYVMAYSRLVDEGLLEKGEDPANFFGSVNYAGGYDRALLAVLNGQADVCAVSDYTMMGPKADVYLNDEQREKLRVLEHTPGVPTHLFAVRTDLPIAVQEGFTRAILKLSKEDPAVFADVYGAAEFKEVGEEHVDKAVKAIENTGLDIRPLAK